MRAIKSITDLLSVNYSEFGRAERVGFEPTIPFGMPVFKTGAFNHSATSPNNPFRRDLLSA